MSTEPQRPFYHELPADLLELAGEAQCAEDRGDYKKARELHEEARRRWPRLVR